MALYKRPKTEERTQKTENEGQMKDNDDGGSDQRPHEGQIQENKRKDSWHETTDNNGDI